MGADKAVFMEAQGLITVAQGPLSLLSPAVSPPPAGLTSEALGQTSWEHPRPPSSAAGALRNSQGDAVGRPLPEWYTQLLLAQSVPIEKLPAFLQLIFEPKSGGSHPARYA